MGASKCSSVTSLSKHNSLALSAKLATATELSNTSCSQCSRDGAGVITSLFVTSRKSWLARGLNIMRCSPKRTGSE